MLLWIKENNRKSPVQRPVCSWYSLNNNIIFIYLLLLSLKLKVLKID